MGFRACRYIGFRTCRRTGSSLLLPLVSLLSTACPTVAQIPVDSVALSDSAKLLSQEAEQAYQQGTREALELALDLWAEASELYRRLGDRHAQGTTLNNMGTVHRDLGRPDSALVYCNQSLAISREVGDRRREGKALGNIGIVQDMLGRPDSALVYYGQALAIRREVGDRRGEAAMLGNIGLSHDRLGRPDSALVYIGQALAIMREVGDRQGEGNMLGNIGLVYDRIGQPDSALVYYGESLAIMREVGDRQGEGNTLNNMAGVHDDLGRPDSALVYYGQALAISREVGDRRREGGALGNIGVIHDLLGHPDSALVYYGQALAIKREVGDRRGEAYTLHNIGIVHDVLGRPDSALVYYRQSLGIMREMGDRRAEGATLGAMGILHNNLGRPDSALVYYRQALAIMREVGFRGGEAYTLINIGFVHRVLSRPDSALVYYRQALAISREVEDRRGEGITLGNLGNVHDDLGRPDSALFYHREALAIKREVGDRRGEGETLNNIGLVHDGLGHPDSALVLFRKALALGRETSDPWGEGAALRNLGGLYQQDLTLRDLKKAVAYYDSAAAVRAQPAAHAGSDPNRLSYAEQYVGLFQDWALAWLALAQELGWEPAARGALAAVERGRAQALLELMWTSAGAAEAVLSPVQALTRPGADLAAEGTRLAEAVTRSGAAGLSYLITDDTLLVWLIEPSGRVVVARQPISQDSVTGLVRALRAGLGVDDATAGAQLALRALELETPLARTDAALLRRGLRYAENAAEALARLLLPAELADRLPADGELVIVPQGPLALVPFSALPLGAAGGVEEFGNRYAIRYAPSLATLDLAERRPGVGDDPDRSEALRQAVVVGNPQMPEVAATSGERSGLAPLPRAEDEAAWLAERLGVLPLTGAEATESAVRRGLATSRFVHLATHGYAYSTEARARQSFVALAPDEQHDGLLTVGEILDDPELELQAELVVLSACQTGLGDLKEAEGTVGLQRAFLAKGARSVLVSLWSVSDVVTEELMKRFYTHWLEDEDGPSKAEGLRRAQQDVRQTPGWEHPRFWAGFQLVGAT